jgi:uncharacterized repeat protein (TIGR01451 family)
LKTNQKSNRAEIQPFINNFSKTCSNLNFSKGINRNEYFFKKSILITLLIIFTNTIVSHAQLSCITKSISSQPNIGTLASPNYLIAVDANNCPTIAPTANYVVVKLCNPCANSVYVGNLSFTGSNLSAVQLTGSQATTQYVGTLLAGECRNVYFHIQWPCNPSNADVSLTMSFQMNDGIAVSNMTFNFTKRRLIDANAGGIVQNYWLHNTDILGGITTIDATYNFGNFPNSNSVLAFQPISDTTYNSGCFQLIKSQVVNTSAASCIPLGYGDLAYVPPGGNGTVCDNGTITVRYYFKSLCQNAVTNLFPMTYASSGNQIKKKIGTSTGTPITLTSNPGLPTISKTVDKTSAIPGDTLKYGITICNNSVIDTCSIDKITDILPTGLEFIDINPSSAISSSEFNVFPSLGSTGTLNFVSGINTTNGFNTIMLSPNTCRVLNYRIKVPSGFTNFGNKVNSAFYSIGSYLSDTVSASVCIGNNTANIIANAGVDKNLDCNLNSTTIGTASVVGNIYSWIPSVAINNVNVAQPTVSPSTTTIYTVTVTNSEGCTATSSVTVNVNKVLPTATITGNTTVCNGSKNLLTATGGVSYVWSNAANTDTTSVGVGTYTVTVTGSNGCSASASFTNINMEGSIGNYVWSDFNNNGINDEPVTAGINGIAVELWNATTSTLLLSTTTVNDESNHPGHYQFTVCANGNYKVKFPTSIGANGLTTQTSILDTDNNSDANTVSGESPVFMMDLNGIGLAKNNNTIDAGYLIGQALGVKELRATRAIISNPNKSICNLNWLTNEEQNTSYFTIERSTDSKTYYAVGNINANNNTTGITNYSFEDNIDVVKNASVIYYRIRLTDIDRKETMSNVISARQLQENSNIKVKPVPFTDFISIDFQSTESTVINVMLTDATGRIVRSMNHEIEIGNNTIRLNQLEQIAKGAYYLRIVNNHTGVVHNQKLIK